MKVDGQKMHRHFMKLSAYYTIESARFVGEDNFYEAEFWAGKSYAMQYAASLLEEENAV